MTNTIWNNPVSGNWTNAADWSAGVPNSGIDALLNVAGAYTVTLSSAGQAQSLTVDATGAKFVETSSGSLDLAAGLTIDAGTVTLKGANTFANPTTLNGGLLRLGNSGAVGELDIAGGSVVATNNVALNIFNASGSFDLSAAAGQTLTLDGQSSFNLSGADTIEFGSSTNDGEVLWELSPFSVTGHGYQINVNGGVLQDANKGLGNLLKKDGGTTVAAGASIDIDGHFDTISKLSGLGVVTSSPGSGHLTLVGTSTFSGSIQGNVKVVASGATTFEGANTYTGGTSISSGSTLTLKDSGSIGGGIEVNGTLKILNSQSLGFIGGAGTVVVANNGALTMTGTSTLTGALSLQTGTLVASSDLLDLNQLSFAGRSEFESTLSQVLSERLYVGGTAKILADHGTTLTLNHETQVFAISSGASVTFGNATADGTVVWDTPAASTSQAASITVAGGTLRAGDSNFQTLFDNESSVTIQSSATLDVAGAALVLNGIHGAGEIENSGALAAVTLNGGNFSGTIAGNVTLDVGGSLMLSGSAENWSTINLLAGSHLSLNGPSSANLVLSSSDNIVVLVDPAHFTGSIAALQSGDEIVFKGIDHGATLSYSGDSTGGTLTVSSVSEGLSYSIALVGDYSADEFSKQISTGKVTVFFHSSAPVASAHADTFDFSATPVPYVAPGVGAMSLHGGHGVEVAFAHDVTQALHAHGLALEHFMHDLFAHGHEFAEALL